MFNYNLAITTCQEKFTMMFRARTKHRPPWQFCYVEHLLQKRHGCRWLCQKRCFSIAETRHEKCTRMYTFHDATTQMCRIFSKGLADSAKSINSRLYLFRRIKRRKAEADNPLRLGFIAPVYERSAVGARTSCNAVPLIKEAAHF